MTPSSPIARYRITYKLGEGGMGAAYGASDTKLNRDVAMVSEQLDETQWQLTHHLPAQFLRRIEEVRTHDTASRTGILACPLEDPHQC